MPVLVLTTQGTTKTRLVQQGAGEGWGGRGAGGRSGISHVTLEVWVWVVVGSGQWCQKPNLAWSSPCQAAVNHIVVVALVCDVFVQLEKIYSCVLNIETCVMLYCVEKNFKKCLLAGCFNMLRIINTFAVSIGICITSGHKNTCNWSAGDYVAMESGLLAHKSHSLHLQYARYCVVLLWVLNAIRRSKHCRDLSSCLYSADLHLFFNYFNFCFLYLRFLI